MTGQSLLERFQQDAPFIFIFLVILLSNLPKPGTKWNGSTLYTWFYNTIQSFIDAISALLGKLNKPEPQKKSSGEKKSSGDPS
jgi:hypothetical protein